MTKTITVKGVGSVTEAPDYVVIEMRMETQANTYEKTMQLADHRINQLNQSLMSIGFEENDCKTTDFDIRTNYKQINYKDVLVGFTCRHSLKIAFDFQKERLAQVLNTLSNCDAKPTFHISFTMKDPTAISERLLRSAASNAIQKARILCEASGVQLGDLQTIDYCWGEIDIYSTTECYSQKLSAAITPEDINVSDTATFVWEIK